MMSLPFLHSSCSCLARCFWFPLPVHLRIMTLNCCLANPCYDRYRIITNLTKPYICSSTILAVEYPIKLPPSPTKAPILIPARRPTGPPRQAPTSTAPAMGMPARDPDGVVLVALVLFVVFTGGGLDITFWETFLSCWLGRCLRFLWTLIISLLK